MGDYVMSFVWAAILITAIIVETESAEMVAIWFVPGAIVSLILSLLKVPEWIQWLTFVLLSAALLVLAFKFFRRLILKDTKKEKTDTELLIGKQARVEEDINNATMTGSVRIDGKVWTARMADEGETALAGEFVTVECISGVKLICRRTDHT